MTNTKNTKSKNFGKGFTGRRKGTGPPMHRRTVKTAREAVDKEARKEKAWQLLLADMTFDQIAKTLNYSKTRCYLDCREIYESLRERTLNNAEFLVAQQNGQIAALIRTHWAKRDNKTSADVILRSMERRAKLNGLDKQREDWLSPAQFKALMAGLTQVTIEALRRFIGDEAIRAEASRYVSEQWQAIAPKAIAGTVVKTETAETIGMESETGAGA